jgi:hypothetical protein
MTLPAERTLLGAVSHDVAGRDVLPDRTSLAAFVRLASTRRTS